MTRPGGKSLLIGAALLLILGGTAARLKTRWQEEKTDHRLVFMVDWSEVHDAAARTGTDNPSLLKLIASSGVNALLVGPSTVQDYLWQHMTFHSRALAEAVRHQLEERGVGGVELKGKGKSYTLTIATKSWEQLKDVELGFNPELLGLAREAGLHVVLRVNNDPWLSADKLFADIAEIGLANQELGFLLNTDDVPGGKDAVGSWCSLLESQGSFSLLFEFHPSKSALKIGTRAPQLTYRAHTIPSAEIKDLTVEQQFSRWRRAVEERSCRFLLFHMAPSDSLISFFQNISAMSTVLIHKGWEKDWPRNRVTWHFPSFPERTASPLLALCVAILMPLYALYANRTGTLWKSYLRIFVLTLAGACVMAALADNPLSRLEIVPFRGVKLAFAAAWLGSFLMLYTRSEIENELFRTVRRVDVLLGLLVAAVAGYLLVRSGNAGPGWKVGWEQGFRDRLEFIFVARPRFKEFAIGYPLLLLGFHMKRKDQTASFWQDGRFWIGVGMIGPISMVNTFCHLHSPLYLAFFRSLNGFLLGTVIGLCLIKAKEWRS